MVATAPEIRYPREVNFDAEPALIASVQATF